MNVDLNVLIHYKAYYMKKIIIVSFILAVACHRVFAAEDSVSQQVQQLNTQIQAQLQAIQADQQKQIQALNKQVEAYLKGPTRRLKDIVDHVF